MSDQGPGVQRRLNVLPQNPQRDEDGRAVKIGRFPSWLHRSLSKGGEREETENILSKNRLHTVCEEAKCPNLAECWSRGTATFLVMGRSCTRSCGFCDIDFAKIPGPLDPEEPLRVAKAAQEMGLRHIVITMVARDDLVDGGSGHLVEVMKCVRIFNAEAKVEVLTSDFSGNESSWQAILEADPDVFNHNIETVRELTCRVRHKATYERTLALLRYASLHRLRPATKIKSGLMVGLGETDAQVFQALVDLKEAGCDGVTIGQYLQPRRNKLQVKAFVTPEKFKQYEEFGYRLGFSFVFSGPFVRSSYHADAILK